ncbi:MAG: UDP-N-acetylmuramate dehydrogenase [Candidatus Cloacimonetes bacterium]|nr:UDP-N-acetylmuramate dehydrogenase [Candidatus Cloacimonadota bacterium]MBS3766644.1 UDP-N-acetylmuramate dehydrogenase [Candidatus Cloacimonadota bacterium]
MDNQEIIKNFIEEKKLEVSFDHSLQTHTTIGTGGKADFFFAPSHASKLKEMFRFICDNKINYKIIGNGSNLLVSDKGVRGFVITLENLPQKINIGSNFIQVSSNYINKDFINFCIEQGASGMEFLSGIPGTMGGLIAMNAGAFDFEIGNFIEDINVIDNTGTRKNIIQSEIEFNYRKTKVNLHDYVIISSRLNYEESTSEEVKKQSQNYLEKRNTLHLNKYPTFGSVFRNGDGYYAGEVIEKCDLKGKKIGDAKISEEHANFIINNGNANSADVFKLIKLAKVKAKEKFGIHLQTEVRLWGDFSYVS